MGGSHLPPLLLALVAGLWVIWFIGVGQNNDVITEAALVAFNLLGFWAISRWTRHLPAFLRGPLLGLGLGFLIIGIGYVLLLLGTMGMSAFGSAAELINLAGALIGMISAAFIPWAMERSNLAPEGHGSQILIGSAVVGILLTLGVVLVRPSEPLQVLFLFVSLFLATLFIWNALILAGGRIGRSLQILNYSLVSIGLSRVAFVLIPGSLSYRVTDFFFLLALSLIVLGSFRQAPGGKGAAVSRQS
ncbi:hypothetical protein [Calidithermus chliarophilus]|uniref:hypothetical protein n=1 Tax=Calidithermus chliarophilus TaxID=52023 RepID=UPI0004814224|nr:hypothetical protein [Calidithermus chliarophilus]